MIYDDLYRLTSTDGKFGKLSYSYDANGNRQTRGAEGETITYQYTSATNQLELIIHDEPVDLVTDSAGNIIMYGDLDLSYNAANRLSQVEAEGEALGSYTYSADGRRVKKVVDGQTTVFHYDLNGNLIAESNGQGNFTKLYLYLEHVPFAMITVDGGTQSIYYYHTDHLGTPRKMTDGDGTVVWAADYLPFGQAQITVETVVNNLRFAGQYFDAETGLHYNFWRYYDPVLGRYLRVDPIGLVGGMNPYVYVKNNPGNWVDSFGLYWEETNAGGWNQFEGPPEPQNAFWNNVLDDYACKNNSGNFISEEEIRSQISLGEIPIGPGNIFKGLDTTKRVQDLLKGTGQIPALLRNKNLKGVDVQGLLNKKQFKTFMKHFEGRDLHHGK